MNPHLEFPYWSTPLEQQKQTVSSLSCQVLLTRSISFFVCEKSSIGSWICWNLFSKSLSFYSFYMPKWTLPGPNLEKIPPTKPPSNTLSSLALCHAKAGTPSICTSATCKTLEGFMPLINGAACSLVTSSLPNSLCCMSASGPAQLGSPPKKSRMNHVVFLFVGSFIDTWHVVCLDYDSAPFLKPQVVAVTAGCQIERLRHGGTGAWTSPPGHWVEAAFQANRAQGHRFRYQGLKVQYEAIDPRCWNFWNILREGRFEFNHVQIVF